MNISTDAEISNKIQYPFLVKILYKLGIEWNFLNLIKGIYIKPTANIIFNDKRLNIFL